MISCVARITSVRLLWEVEHVCKHPPAQARAILVTAQVLPMFNAVYHNLADTKQRALPTASKGTRLI